jgi:hypothetical protein
MDGIRGALWLPKLLGEGCHSAELDTTFHVQRQFTITVQPTRAIVLFLLVVTISEYFADRH